MLSLGKVVTPYQTTFAIPMQLYYAMACVEGVLAIGILTKHRSFAAIVAVCLFGFGVLTALLYGGDCG